MKIHRVNFYAPKPSSIVSISYDALTCRLAVSRSDNTIEIWNVKANLYQETIIPGDADLSVQATTWCDGRLFSCGAHGYVLEYDIHSLMQKSQLLVMSGCPIYCMSVNSQKTQMAVGNEEGYVSLIDIWSGGIDFDKRFDKQEGAIICLAWHKDDNIIATGSKDAIRTWDVRTGRVINRIMLSRVAKNTPTIVWCIAILSDMTIVSGDSCGKTSFWDGNTGTLISSLGSKKGDILSIAVSSNEDVIYTSGVEPTIMTYMQSQSNRMWMKSIQRVVHTHDVWALQLVGDLLISGGNDCNLVCTKYPPKVVITFYPFCQKTHATIAPKISCMLLQYQNEIELWKIGEKNPVCLLQIKPKSNERIIASSTSSTGEWIAYSTRDKIRLFCIELNLQSENHVSMSKVDTPKEIPWAKILLFSNDSTKLVAYGENKIFFIKCLSTTIEAVIEDTDSIDAIHLMQLNVDDSYLACGCLDGNVIVYCLKTFQVFCKLPVYKCPPTALTFSSSENLVVAYSDGKVVEFSISKQAYTNWSKQDVLNSLKESLYPVISMCSCKDKLFLLEENAIHVIDKSDQILHTKKKIKQSEKTETLVNESSFLTLKNHEHLSSIHSFNGEIVLVQIPAKPIINALPPPIWKKVYGT